VKHLCLAFGNIVIFTRRKTMETEGVKNEIGRLTLSIAPDTLRSIIASGRLLELADTIAKEAAAQISAQLVGQVASEALKTEGLSSGVAAGVSFIFDGGDFGTVPPRPKWGVVRLDEIAGSPLQRLATGATISGD
jgi:regulator of protease activity HflC (stomatin/prohibitin superfamily)